MDGNGSETKLDEISDARRERLSQNKQILRVYHDERDHSVHPSYTRFEVPYHILCARRYVQKRLEYEQQFEYEINQLINYMDSGASAVIFGRHIAYTSLWPPLHTRMEIKNTEKFFRLSRKKTERLNYLMENVIR